MTKSVNPVTAATATATVLLGKFSQLAYRQEVVVDKTNPFIGYFQKALQSPKNERLVGHRFDWASSNNRLSSRVNEALDSIAYPNASMNRLGGASALVSATLADMTSIPSRYQSHFKELKILGRGGQGRVFEVQNVIDGARYAVKKIELQQGGSRLKQALREVQVMAGLPHHRNIVRYFGSWIETSEEPQDSPADAGEDSDGNLSSYNSFVPSFSTCGIAFESNSNQGEESISSTSTATLPLKSSTNISHTLFIQMELCEQLRSHAILNNLTSWMRITGAERITSSFLHEKAMRFFKDIVRGVQHLHEHGIIHRDIKPDNIFMSHGIAKVGDFGLSTTISNEPWCMIPSPTQATDSSHTTQVGTFLYASPEQVSSDQAKTSYSEKSDIFGLGLILLELCSHFTTAMERVQVLTSARHGVLPTTIFPKEMALVSSMTALNPLDRPSAEQVLRLLSPVNSSHVKYSQRLL
ncbi:hypothetical protein LEN26_015231 [Aphanomyces euteiches]|nr:hypothetical protein AeMF1_021828 [Aphanomyces euteiches]KAH9103603.1 hypothetical protein AeMF1_020059 [Aphanomyces euteiches]KAH9103667.1 hypothetical protein LEN26_015231 [Aphanomyces euteiches]KAH9119742.1 hypothetical protein AeMF1_007755 [Aphanomyces euteiches]KAH9122316.1 hypothetical protein AeMF1_006315 [Aphanomyces euteiches]